MRWTLLTAGAVALLLAACGSTPETAQSNPTTAPPATRPTSPPPPTPKPTPLPYPPSTLAGLKALAAMGNGDNKNPKGIYEVHSEGTGLVTCPEPKRQVLVPTTLTGEALAADLLAYYFDQGLNNDCGSLILAYHTQDEVAEGRYTGGRVDLTMDGSKHVVTVDAGTEFAVTY